MVWQFEMTCPYRQEDHEGYQDKGIYQPNLMIPFPMTEKQPKNQRNWIKDNEHPVPEHAKQLYAGGIQQIDRQHGMQDEQKSVGACS